MPAEITTLPLYAQYFRDPSENANPVVDWAGFRSHDLASATPLAECAVDFSIKDRQWQDIAGQITFLILKIVIFPWGLYELARYTVQRLIMTMLYPAQSRITRVFLPHLLGAEALNAERQRISHLHLTNRGFIARNVVLEKNGVRYNGLLLGHATTITNGRWALQATGNATVIERAAESYYNGYMGFGYNTLLINGPAVGRSEGHAVPDSIGEAQEIGISFLETALKGKKIVIAGLSLGGAAMGQAILKHHFKADVRYLAVQQMTFDSVSNVCAEAFGKLKWLVKKIVIWSGCEMDTVAASRKLQELGIPEVIVQASWFPVAGVPALEHFVDDGLIPAEASYGYRLVEEGVLGGKVFRCLPLAEHMTPESLVAAHAEILAL